MFGDNCMLYFAVTIFWKNIILQNTNNKCSANFDHKFEHFRVASAQLKDPTTHRSFNSRIEDWEEESIQKYCCGIEGHLLNKYKELSLYHPDDEVTHTVY